MWSFGCIIVEMLTGRPLFQARNELELLEMIKIRVGLPPKHMIERAKKKSQFFDAQGKLLHMINSRVNPNFNERCQSVKLELSKVGIEDDEQLIDFIERCITIDPADRMTPTQALQHPWITRGWISRTMKRSISASC